LEHVFRRINLSGIDITFVINDKLEGIFKQILIGEDLIELSSISIPCMNVGDAIRLVTIISNLEDNLNVF
jgi:hypothetical protein